MLRMESRALLLVFLFCAPVYVVRGALEDTPLNDAVLVGDTVILRCTVTNPDTVRIIWTEFATSSGGQIISDGRVVSGAHPNAARYSIAQTDPDYSLTISDVIIGDGGTYLCQDFNSAGNELFRGYSELVVLESDPSIEYITTETGSLVEGFFYSSECIAKYQGHIPPLMTWTGPGIYNVDSATTLDTVYAYLSFTASRDMIDGSFDCLTNFAYEAAPDKRDDNFANNNPTYNFSMSATGPVSMDWPPQNMSITPVQATYDVFDVLTCYADSNPPPTYLWYNLNTGINTPGPLYTVTEAMVGITTALRCQVTVNINGALFSGDAFQNVTVLAPTIGQTTTPVPPTTPALPDGPCSDPTGRWRSNNPDADLCITVDSRGTVLALLRNGTDTTFILGSGKTVAGDYKHVGFTAVWLPPLGVAGFVGECHNCYGNEQILFSGLARNFYNSPGCGTSAGTSLTRLYVFTKVGTQCLGAFEVANPNPVLLAKMGVTLAEPGQGTSFL